MITETVVSPITAPKIREVSDFIGSIELTGGKAFDAAYLESRRRPEATFILAKNDIKAGRLLVSEKETNKTEVIIFNGVSLFAVGATIEQGGDSLDLSRANIGSQISYDRLFKLYDIFPAEYPLNAVVIGNSRYNQTANESLAKNLRTELGGQVAFLDNSAATRSFQFSMTATTFNPINGELNIYNWLEKCRICVKTVNKRLDFISETGYTAYLDYLSRYGHLTYPDFIETQTKLTREIFDSHPSKKSGLMESQDNFDQTWEKVVKLADDFASYVKAQTGIDVGGRELQLYINLRLINEGEMVTYGKGWRPPDDNGNRSEIGFGRPGSMAGMVLLDEIFKMTNNKESGDRLAVWFAQNLPENELPREWSPNLSVLHSQDQR